MPFLAACGFQPLYGDSAPAGVRADLAAVEVGLIEDRIGQQMRNELVRRFHPDGRARNPSYRLQVKLSVDKRDLALQKSEIATRASLRITATYALRKNMDGKQLIQGTTRITTSYDILRSDFATLAAEADARRRGVRELADEITNRLAAYLQYSKRG
ncbi:MAG: LPS assembly lipoprotein LptE [Rhodospirillales bacterium]|nr:LPS assembly lipoprotein LptE [Rhodospirillales bacterium]